MLTSNYDIEIAQLKNQQDCTYVMGQLDEPNGKIRKLVKQESPRIVRSKILNDDIKTNDTTSVLSNDDYK